MRAHRKVGDAAGDIHSAGQRGGLGEAQAGREQEDEELRADRKRASAAAVQAVQDSYFTSTRLLQEGPRRQAVKCPSSRRRGPGAGAGLKTDGMQAAKRSASNPQGHGMQASLLRDLRSRSDGKC